MDTSSELSSLLATLEEITARVTRLVESSESEEGVDGELVQLERSLTGSLRRLRRALKTAQRS